ncbi:MAG TPA: NADH-quinone oxidoreductase subunit NuoG [Fimbriimonadaceae bacterium]|nr:NADH-quinone oxidoreductase subunit NuoG [Fimbriimonadaceae bacterium]
MAAAADTQNVTIQINDVEIQVPKGELIVESVKRLGLEIPIFCYHPRMKPVGMCRMCLVEVGFKGPDGSIRKMPKPQAACTLPASEGMAVYTDTQMVHTDRKGVLEFLLVNHPLDCPICDRGGECPLQNNTLFYGPSTSRFVELKRHLPKAFHLSKYVTLDLERCIQCGRCVRFTEEISGDAQLAFRFRGASMQPSTYEMTDFTSKFSGNVIEICPVGALTNATYRFRARPWDLETRPAICTVCSNGCNVWFDYRVNRMVRINGRTNEAVNEEWTCDRGKFGHEFYNGEKRLTKPLVRRGDVLVEASWPEAYDEIARAFVRDESALLGGAENSNEDLFMAKRVFKHQFASDHVDHRFQTHLPVFANLDLKQKPIASYESAATILIFGTSLADEEPILFLRIRKAWAKHGAKVIVVSDKPTDADAFASVVLRYKPEAELEAAQALAGKGDAGFPADQLAACRAALADGKAAIVATQSIYNAAKGPDVVAALAKLGELSVYGLLANDQGAQDLGFYSEAGTHEILRRCESGQIQALWLMGADPFAVHPEPDLVRRAIENVSFLVVQAHTENEAFHYASIVLPMCAPAEMEGTYTNLERRVQRMNQVLPVKGEAKPAWRVFSELALRMSGERPFFNPGEIMGEIAKEIPAFSAIDYDALGGSEGVILEPAKTAATV